MKNEKLIFFTLGYFAKIGAYSIVAFSTCNIILTQIDLTEIFVKVPNTLFLSIILGLILGIIAGSIHNVYNYINRITIENNNLIDSKNQLEKLHKQLFTDYKELQEQYNGLESSNNIIKTNYNNIYKDFNHSLEIVNSIVNDIELGIKEITEKETKYLTKLHEITFNKQQYLENIKGDYNE